MKKIAPDKWKHFFVGIAMGMVLQAIAWWWFPARIYLATTLVFAVIVFISYGFELYSKFTGHGHYEVMDAVASVIGGILGMAAAMLFIASIWGLYSHVQVVEFIGSKKMTVVTDLYR